MPVLHEVKAHLLFLIWGFAEIASRRTLSDSVLAEKSVHNCHFAATSPLEGAIR